MVRWLPRRPRHDRNGADRIGRRAIDDLGADRQVDERVVRPIRHAINAGRLEKYAGFLTEHFFVITELRQVDVDWAVLPARDRKIGWIFVQTERLAPPAFSGLRNVAHDAGHLRIFKDADAHLVVGRKRIKGGADAVDVGRVCRMNRYNDQYGHHKKPPHSYFSALLRRSAPAISYP